MTNNKKQVAMIDKTNSPFVQLCPPLCNFVDSYFTLARRSPCEGGKTHKETERFTKE